MAPFFARSAHHPFPTTIDVTPFNGHSFPFGGPPAFGGFAPRDFGLGNFIRDIDELFGGDDFPARSQQQQSTSWNPRFDVEENEEAYELRGEVPGVEGKDLDVRFVDPKTLVVKGSTTSETANTSEQVQASAPQSQQVEESGAKNEKLVDDDVKSTHSNDSNSSYVRPSVEDTVDDSEKAGDATMTPATSSATAGQPESSQQEQTNEGNAQQPHYWVSERSTGSFQRTFKFSSKIDQDNVTAGLKNGVLSLRVPKIKAIPHEEKRIHIG